MNKKKIIKFEIFSKFLYKKYYNDAVFYTNMNVYSFFQNIYLIREFH